METVSIVGTYLAGRGICSRIVRGNIRESNPAIVRGRLRKKKDGSKKPSGEKQRPQRGKRPLFSLKGEEDIQKENRGYSLPEFRRKEILGNFLQS